MASAYTGSRLLEGLTGYIGLPIDQINFVACQFVALGLSFAYRIYLHPSKVSPSLRHAAALSFGLFLGVFCFGSQIWHLFAQSSICYLIMRLLPPQLGRGYVFVVAMVYLAAMHIYRQIYDYGGYTLDISGPMMISTQKLSSLAFSISDGMDISPASLSEDQQGQAVKGVPNILEFYSYIFYFHGTMAGPLCFYSDYKAFVEGYNFWLKMPMKDKTAALVIMTPSDEPSPNAVVKKKVIISMISLLIMLTLMPHFPIMANVDETFISKSQFPYRLFYLVLSINIAKSRYYFAWILADAVNNAAGLGFNGFDEQGQAKWNLITNIDMYNLERASSFKMFIDHWNIQTGVWLRRICYDRAPFQRTLFTYMLSAFWHGFYPGYYFTFLTGGLMTTAARVARHHVRPYFISSFEKKTFYDFITCILTHIAISYTVAPFTFLELRKTVQFYKSMKFFMHIAVGIVILLSFLNSTKHHLQSWRNHNEPSNNHKSLVFDSVNGDMNNPSVINKID